MKYPNMLLFSASPRRGNSEAVAESLSGRGLARGAFAPILFLRKNLVRPCAACGQCAGTGTCVFEGKDHGHAVLNKLNEAPGLVVISPVYFYGPPAQLKAVIDRSQALWEKNGCQCSEVKRPAYAVLTASRMGGERLFEASLLILRCFFDVMGFRLEDALLLRGLDGPEDFAASSDAQYTLNQWCRDRLGW